MKCSKIYISILLLLTTFSLPSCNNQHKKADRAMEVVGSIIESHPDSALALLDSVISPSLLNKERYHRYMLLLLQAKDKSYQDITSDTAIFATKHYYVKKNDLPHVAMAAYYCGRLRFEQKDYKSAMTQYVEAERYAANIADVNLKALIQSAMGAVLSEELLEDRALTRFQQAAKYFQQARNARNEMISYQLIGGVYLVKLQTDSSLFYFNKSLKMAETLKDSSNILVTKQNIGILYKEVEDNHTLAKKYFIETIRYATGNDYSRLCLKLADIYSSENKRDSAEWYMAQSLSRLQDKKDAYLVADIYNTIAIIKEREADYRASSEYYKRYADCQDSIFKETRDATLLSIERKYKFEQLKNDNMALVLEKQRILLYSAIGGLLSLFVIMLFYRRNTLIKRQELEAEQKVYHLMDMAKTFDEKEQSFRNVLLHQFDIVKKTATLSNYIHKEDEKANKLLKKFNEIVYGKEGLNWDVLYETMNDLQSGFFERLREKFPDLTEDEFRICCLTCTDFSRDEISIIMEMSVSSVQSKRNAIRKKLGIPPIGKIKSFLEQEVSIS